MTEQKDLQIELKKLQKQIKEKEKELKESQSKYKETAKWKKIQKRKEEIDKRQDFIRKEVDKKKKKTRELFLEEDDWHPYYDKGSSYFGRTNINPEVISAIQKNFKISLLRSSDIEKIVRNMINIESQKDKEFQKFSKELGKLSGEEDELWDAERYMEKGGDEGIETELRKLYDKRQEINFKIKNPKLAEQHDKRQEERQKVDNSKIIRKTI